MSYVNWSHLEVANWLTSLNLNHLIPNFEKMQIDGTRLATLSEQDLRVKLRIHKPAEVIAVRGAIGKLVDDELALEQLRHVNSHKFLVGPNLVSWERAGCYDKKSGPGNTKSLPHDAHLRNITSITSARHPKPIQSSASELILQSRYSGWIRKQGGSYKNWKKRYLILRLGCLYYFKDEVASSPKALPKGSFVLSGYKTEICQENEIVKKCRYTLKLIPMNPQVRTYYISFGSQRELTGWKEAIDDEIISISPHSCLENPRRGSMLPGVGGRFQQGFDDDDDDDGVNNPYDIPELKEEDSSGKNYSYNPSDSVIYERPKSLFADDSEDDPYSKIDETYALSLRSDSKPTVPDRSALSLLSTSASSFSASIPSSSLSPPSILLDAIGDEVAYLPIVSGGPSSDPAAAQPDLARSPPPTGTADITFVTSSILDQDCSESDDADDSEADDNSDGGYYIMFRRPEELMPPSCIFDRLERVEVNRLLKDNGTDGTYLIREGTHAGAEKIISVWNVDRCRHYKLHKDENSSFSLIEGQAFRTIPELLQYYALQQKLPRSDFYLGNPFKPLQD